MDKSSESSSVSKPINGAGESPHLVHPAMNLQELHFRFCSLYRKVVDSRRALALKDDWLVQCYDDFPEFKRRFPDFVECEAWLREREIENKDTKLVLHQEMERILQEGLGYLDVEKMNHVLPNLVRNKS